MTQTHLLTLTWDDGFATSFRAIAEIHEAYGLRASLNVIAQACVPGAYTPADEWHNAPVGGWELWNELQRRGHEINPHSWSHRDHAAIPLEEAKGEVDLCLEAFERNLKDFDAKRSVYGFPFNASNPAIEAYVTSKCRAGRTGGDGFNPLPTNALVRIHSAVGPSGNNDAHLEGCVAGWLAKSEGWLIWNGHGLDAEGWGPVTPDCVRRIYDRLLKLGHVRILTPGEALNPG